MRPLIQLNTSVESLEVAKKIGFVMFSFMVLILASFWFMILI